MTPAQKRSTRVLVIDDQTANLALVKRLLGASEFDVLGVRAVHDVLDTMRHAQPDVVLLDVRMPRRDGFQICRELKEHAATRLVPVVLMTASSQPKDRLAAIEAGADDFVTKPLNTTELRARVRSLARVKRFTDDLENAEQVIVSLALTIEARDAYTEGHCQRLAWYAMRVGQALGLSQEDLRALQRGGFLHDVGKIGIPDAILLKPGRLSRAEFDIMKTHPAIGERLCGDLRSLQRVRPIVRHHHERLDGSGYPDGLAGDAIPLLAQIIGLVDVYDALTTTRPYRAALTPDAACDELRREVEHGWREKDLVAGLIRLAESGELVAL